MASIIIYTCDSCNFTTDIFLRGEVETQLYPNDSSPKNNVFCLGCLKNVNISIHDTKCSDCLGWDFINGKHKENDEIQCPMCKVGMLSIEDGPIF